MIDQISALERAANQHTHPGGMSGCTSRLLLRWPLPVAAAATSTLALTLLAACAVRHDGAQEPPVAEAMETRIEYAVLPAEDAAPRPAVMHAPLLSQSPIDFSVNNSVVLGESGPLQSGVDHENYAHFKDNPIKLVAEQPVSTFSKAVSAPIYHRCPQRADGPVSATASGDHCGRAGWRLRTNHRQ